MLSGDRYADRGCPQENPALGWRKHGVIQLSVWAGGGYLCAIAVWADFFSGAVFAGSVWHDRKDRCKAESVGADGRDAVWIRHRRCTGARIMCGTGDSFVRQPRTGAEK